MEKKFATKKQKTALFYDHGFSPERFEQVTAALAAEGYVTEAFTRATSAELTKRLQKGDADLLVTSSMRGGDDTNTGGAMMETAINSNIPAVMFSWNKTGNFPTHEAPWVKKLEGKPAGFFGFQDYHGFDTAGFIDTVKATIAKGHKSAIDPQAVAESKIQQIARA